MAYEAPVLRTLGDLRSLTLRLTVTKGDNNTADIYGDPDFFAGSVISVTP
jgi:hypothetical protein